MHAHSGRIASRTLMAVLIVTLLALSLPLPGSVAAQQSATAGGDGDAIAVAGTVYDSLAGKPLRGALVQLAHGDLRGRIWSDRTDSLGSFRMADVPAGEYIVGFTHPSLDSLGLEVPAMKLVVKGSDSVTLSLAIPSATSIRAQICPATSSADSSGLLLGFVRDANTGARIDDANVILDWAELMIDRESKEARANHRTVVAKATKHGWYARCGVPAATPVTARAEARGDASGYVELVVPARGVLHRDFAIARSAAESDVAKSEGDAAGEASVSRGSAALSGVVHDELGKPLADARISVWGAEVTATSLNDGTFTLSRLPAGTQTVEVRHIGYAPERVAVDLANGRTRSITIAMTQQADILSDVTVYGRDRMLANVLAGFDQRRALGFGRFLTRADIVRKQPLHFTDLLRSTPGFKVVTRHGNELAIVSSRAHGDSEQSCPVSIYLNGARLKDQSDINVLVEPNEVAAMELYSGISDTPPQFGRSECGSVVIWTFPNLDRIDAEP